MASVSLAEELLLLAYDDESGKAVGSRIGLDLGMAGAVLIELALAGRLVLSGGEVMVRDAAPIGGPIADEILAKVAADTPHTPASWVQRLRHGLRDRVLADLVARGVVRDVDETALNFIHLHRYPTVDPSVEQEIRARLTVVITGQDQPDQRTAALATLIVATRMEPLLGRSGDDATRTHQRLAQIADRAGFTSGNLEDSIVRPSVALVVIALTDAIRHALGRA